MSKKYIGILFFLLTTAYSQAQSYDKSDPKAREIVRRIIKNVTGYGQYTVEMTMNLVMENGKTFERKIRQYVVEQPQDFERTIGIFRSPADVKGSKMLMFAHADQNDDQWIYLPALNRPKRIANENKSGAFFGSEIAFEDLGNSKLEKFEYHLQREENYKGRDCFVLKNYPISKYSGYSVVEVYVDKSSYLNVEDRYFDKKGDLVKVAIPEYRQFKNNTVWLPVKLSFKNVKNGRSTVMTWSDYNFNAKIDPVYLSPEKFMRLE